MEPAFYLDALIVSGFLWSLAFMLFRSRVRPVLTRAGADSRPG